MFTGLVEEKGRVAAVEGGSDGLRLWIEARLAGEVAPGDSVAVSGVCLTVTGVAPGALAVDVVPETLRVTTLGLRRAGDNVNLERPVAIGGRFGGHLVQGHVDAVGQLIQRQARGNSVEMTFAAPPEVMRYIVPKGSVAVDGVSLTVIERVPVEMARPSKRARKSRLPLDQPGWGAFRVAVIPYTAAVTTLGALQEGDAVNLEADVVAKYLEALASPYLAPAAGPAEGGR